MTKVYKTLVTVEVLHDEWADLKDIQQIAYEITDGNGSASGLVSIAPRVEVPPDQLAAECDKHGTDIEFFIGSIDDDEPEAKEV